MTTPSTLSLDRLVDITVEINPLAAPRATFNELLIVGDTVSDITAAERLRVYEDAASMLDDGFVDTDPEYVAAQIYFAQTPAPRRLWIGFQDGGESCLEAITACRLAGFDWYMTVCLNAVAADHKLIALWAESATPSTVYAYTTDDADVKQAAPSPADIATFLKNLDYRRTIGQYSTDQGGSPVAYPNNIYAMIAMMGYVCGQNTGLANSAFTLMCKQEVGISTEPLTLTEVGVIEGKNCNLYLSYGNYYSFFEKGVMADGSFFDELINLDMLVNNMQLTVADLLNSSPKIPQTDAGVTQLIHAINQACEQAVTVGFIGPGTWRGANILNLQTGDTLPRGYLVQAGSLADQSDADRELRKSVPFYVCICEAGAVHSVVIGIRVSR